MSPETQSEFKHFLFSYSKITISATTSLPFDLIYRIWTLHTFELEASFVSQPLLQCERLLSAPLVHSQLSRPEQSGAGPTSTDKPLFLCCFSARGLAVCQLITTRGIPAALMIGQPCLLPSPRFLYFNIILYRLGTEQKLNLITSRPEICSMRAVSSSTSYSTGTSDISCL